MGADADVVQRYIDAISTGDLDGIAACLDDGAVFHIGGRNATSGDHSKDAWLEMFRNVLDRAGGAMPVDVHDLLESDDHVVALVRRTMAGLDSRAAVIYHVEGGKITEVWPLELDQYAIDAAIGN